MITSFTGDYKFLSNFFYAQIEYGNHTWLTSEHLYQAMKSPDPEDWEKISKCMTPGAAKRMGKTINIRPDWEEMRQPVMYAIVALKFNSHPMLVKRLIDTGDAELIEGNTWGDTYWGVCKGVGENHLGKILMNLRKHHATLHELLKD
jgi:ribA/ribD-fused uncharacterized protein